MMAKSPTLSSAKVLYFGDPEALLLLLEHNVEIVGIVHGRAGGKGWQHFFRRYPSEANRLRRWIRPDLGQPNLIAELSSLEPNIIVSCFYPDKIPQSILSLGMGFNVHPSDLPKWRGPDPIVHTILDGATETMICVHELVEEVDAGAVYARKPVQIPSEIDAGRLSEVLESAGATFLVDCLLDWLNSRVPVAQPQRGTPTWAPQLLEGEWEIDWSRSAVFLERFVRAAHPFPGAFTGIGDELLVILRATIDDAEGFASLDPGTPFLREGEICIRCGEGALRLHRVRLGRKTLDGERFARLLC